MTHRHPSYTLREWSQNVSSKSKMVEGRHFEKKIKRDISAIVSDGFREI